VIRTRAATLATLAVLVVVTALAGAGAVWAVTAVHRDRGVAAALSYAAPGQGTTFLVVGNDSRESIRADAGNRFGRTDTLTDQRADAVMLVQLPSRAGPVKVLSLPRDLRVEVDGFGPQKLSWVLGYAGRAALVRTVTQLTGVPVQHYVEMDFVGFADLVDAAGGVTLDFPRPGRDTTTGFEVAAGRHRLDGASALAYARSRTYEELGDDGWTFLDDGDLGRIQRQQTLVRAIVAHGRASPSPLGRLLWLRRLGRHVTVDSNLSTVDLLRLTTRLRSLQGTDVELTTLPTVPLVDQEARVSPFPPYHLGTVAWDVADGPAAAEAVATFLSRGPAVSER